MRNTQRFILILSSIFLSAFAHAELQLPYLIADSMVVQRQQSIPVWGWVAPGTEVVLDFDGETKTVRSDSEGAWTVNFSARSAGGPYILKIQNNGTTTSIIDIWVGDVWVGSGQSNMEWPLRNVINAEWEVGQATDTLIRHFAVPKSWALKPESKLAGGSWQVTSPEVAGDFTAVGFFFAKNLRESMDVPIGLIHSSWGGSNIESWMEASLLGMTQTDATREMEAQVATEKLDEKGALKSVNQWPDALVEQPEDSTADWSSIDQDESDWIEIEAPILWESAGFAGMDGIAWYRKVFTLSEEEAAQDLILGLAKIDDRDITWINGVKVGETNAYDQVRRYTVSNDVLKPGKNVIAIRVNDTGGGGGIYSNAENLFFEVNGQQTSLAGSWKFKADKVRVSLSEDKNHTGTALYNKMMAPLFKVPVKGVLWYQGESNANNPAQAYEYRNQFSKLIVDWRERWNNPDMPFLWVQLANFISGNNVDGFSPWAILRDSQTETLSLPNTGQAITIDVGTANNIHPRDKQTVGKRLALEALHKAYGKDNVVSRGPVLKQFEIKEHMAILSFKTNSTLCLKGARAAGDAHLAGFTVAGEDQIFHPARAHLVAGKVVAWSDAVTHPVAVRYAWDDNPESADLMDATGLPAEPFRTDEWLDKQFQSK